MIWTAITNRDITTFTSLKNIAMLDSLLRADYGNSEQANDYSIQLPITINTQLDIALRSGLFLNVSAHIANLNTQFLEFIIIRQFAWRRIEHFLVCRFGTDHLWPALSLS